MAPTPVNTNKLGELFDAVTNTLTAGTDLLFDMNHGAMSKGVVSDGATHLAKTLELLDRAVSGLKIEMGLPL